MKIDLNIPGEINQKSQGYQQLLENLQSNILKSHGRSNVKLLFLQFSGDEDEVKEWIKTLNITSAKDQLEASKIRKENRSHDGGLVLNFFLTSEGYEELGFNPRKLKRGGNRIFNLGMKSNKAHRKLNDPPVDSWEKGYRNEIDALILLADEKVAVIDDAVKKIELEIANIAEILVVESGQKLGEDKEHFGFVDGISNTEFFAKNLNGKHQKNGKTDGNENGEKNGWSSLRPLCEVLVKDPFVKEEANGYGSFFVFRKLQQDVDGFSKEVAKLSKKVVLTNSQKDAGTSEEDYAGALVVGRYKNGTPLALSEVPKTTIDKSNNFNYNKEDPKGLKCPFHAHLRKTNPRDESRIIDKIVVPDRFITRRGIPYGKEADKDKGLLFMCFQSNLRKQFNFMQGSWANSKRFPILRGKPGLDPIIGQEEDGIIKKGEQSWPKSYNEEAEFDFDFGQFVKMVGGEYFFAPSIVFLKSL